MKRWLKHVKKRYRNSHLSTQILLYITALMFLPMIIITIAVNMWNYQDKVSLIVNASIENLNHKGAYLSSYISVYMNPFYHILVNPSLNEILSGEVDTGKFKAYYIFSQLDQFYDASCHDLVGMCLESNEGAIYCSQRLPFIGKSTIMPGDGAEYDTLHQLFSPAEDGVLKTRLLEYNGINCVAISKKIVDFRTGKGYGVFSILLRESGIKGILSASEDRQSFRRYALLAENTVIYQNGQSETGWEVSRQDSRLELRETQIEGTNWTFLDIVDVGAVQKQTALETIQNLMVELAFYVVTLFLVYFVSARRMKTLSRLENVMKSAAVSGEYVPLIKPANGELKPLFEGYNAMVNKIMAQHERIREQNEENIKVLRRRQKAELKMLELEINPHFLHNTLNSINGAAIEAGDFKTSRLLKAFSNILRYMIEDRDKATTYYAEIKWLKNYLYLQKDRFDGAFDYEIDMDPAVSEIKTPKLIFQPFVENSILHGFVGLPRIGMLTILISQAADGYIEVVIADNGNGMPPETAEHVKASAQTPQKYLEINLGIANTCYRLQMYYGDRFTVRIESEEKKGTKVILRFPPQSESGGDLEDEDSDCRG